MRYLTTPEQIGRKEGRNEEKFYIAKKMKKQGFDTPVIKDLTGLKDKDLKIFKLKYILIMPIN